MYAVISQRRFCNLTHNYVLYLQSHISIYICVHLYIGAILWLRGNVEKIKWDAHHQCVFTLVYWTLGTECNSKYLKDTHK